MDPDIFINVRLRTLAEGGRRTNIKGEYYGCPLLVNNEIFECRLLIQGMTLELGKSYEVPVKFLNRDLAMSNLSMSMNISLWEGKEIANGYIVKVCDQPD